MSVGLVLAAFLVGHMAAANSSCQALFNLPGDFIIGGLYPVHSNSTERNRARPLQLPSCESLNPSGYAQFQAMRLAVEEINNSSTLLPNITLGYHIWDTCQESLHLQAAFQLSPHQWCRSHQGGCSQRVIGVVGPDSAEMTQLTARVFTYYGLPQVSYSIKEEIFADKKLFPLLFRTIPSNDHQVSGLISLISAFGWEYISAVDSGTKASEKTVQSLIAKAAAKGICISYQGLMTADLRILESRLQRVIENIEKARTNVVVVLSNAAITRKFFHAVTKLKIKGKVWIAPESWILTDTIASIPNIEQTGTVLGLTVKPVKLPQIVHFVGKTLQRSPSNKTDGPLLSEAPTVEACSQSCDENQLLSPDALANILNSSVWQWSFYSYASVYILAEALHNHLGCSLQGCPASKEFKPRQFYEALYKVNFPLQGNTITLGQEGDLFLGYSVVTWSWENGTATFKMIGSYSSQALNINKSEISWPAPGDQVPKSYCIAVCEVGQIRSKQLLDECLCRCDDCLEGTYQNETGGDTCIPCPPGMWSPLKSSTCFPPLITYLDITTTTILALVILAIVDFFLLFGCLLVFALHRQTPVVKAAGGKLAFVMLASLLASCTTTSLFVGKPTEVTCLIRQPLFAISFTVCVSCLLVRSFQIIFIFKMACKLPPGAAKCWVKYKGTYVSVGLSCGLQALICLLWLRFSPPTLQEDFVSEREVYLQCSEGHFMGLGGVLGYITLLGGACFAFAFWGRNLPKNYSEARLLTTSMLVFLMGWGCFMLIYITTEGKGKGIPALQMFTVQTSVYAILCTFFLPKCYLILFRPQFNTVAHFQTCIQAYTATVRNAEQ
ncbi:taste receptor type 1 member 1-like [Podarcis lilfordi]|uniref:Taste receptor type 1 member 1-like n=1 Tax=Podarcis lilfordi TaxID=74358 RepID=A0AA35KS22_9SAUR|nr:taste receptor type 1 member 1-like [Podarcis lilfordi]